MTDSAETADQGIPETQQSKEDAKDRQGLSDHVGAWRSSWRSFWTDIRGITPSGLLRVVLVLGALFAIGWLISYTWNALIPFQLGVVLAYLLLPIVSWLEKRMPRVVAVAVVFMAGLGGIIIALGTIVPQLVLQLNELAESLPEAPPLEGDISEWITAIEEYIGTLPPIMQTVVDDGVRQAIDTLRGNVVSYAQSTVEFLVNTVLSVAGTFTFLLSFLVVPFWLFFVLADHQKGLRATNYLLPSWMRKDFWAVLTVADRTFSSYIRGQLFLGVLIAIASYLGLTLLEFLGVEGIQYKLLLAVFAGMMELVPYIGPIIGAIPAVAVGLFHSWETAIAIALLYLVIQQLEGNLLIPKVLGESVDIHPAVLTTLLIALTQLGFLWFLLAAPLAATIRDVYRYIYSRISDPPAPAGTLPGKPFAELRAEEEAAARHLQHTPTEARESQAG